MIQLAISLQNSDLAILQVIARFWGVDSESDMLVKSLQTAMTDPERATQIWERLNDEQRGVFHTLLGSKGKMPAPMFERLHGEIRKMGEGAIEREDPLHNPRTVAESLFYRGLIYEGFEQVKAGPRSIIYIPVELIESLPTHITSYDNLEDEPILETTIGALDPEPDESERVPADTTIIDDMTTLLAYLQVYGADVTAEGQLSSVDREGLLPHLLSEDSRRLDFIFGVGCSAELIEVKDRHATPSRADTRRWLELTRGEQLKALVDGWRKSKIYSDLWHVPGLHPEPAGWPYDPLVGRVALIEFLRKITPSQAWFSIDEFILTVKSLDADFQRPAADYDSWYIRNNDGDYLNGFESWDAVDGALLEFYLVGPMHWLGMVDLGMDAAKLTAYGRGFINEGTWPAPRIPKDKIEVQPDGELIVSRTVPAIDRFQAMRFTSWNAIGEGTPYRYKLNAIGIQQAAEQGINPDHIQAFLSRLIEPLPEAIVALLRAWQGGPTANVSIEELTVLRTTSPETLDAIYDTPAIRRYLGARLGPMAVVVRKDQRDALRDALGEKGIDVEL